jgi:glycosyltransferase involved in cell wall biosynthesis
MRNLFGTADIIGTETGGGVVTYYESSALKAIGETITLDASVIDPSKYNYQNTPYVQDYIADATVLQLLSQKIDIAHFYSGMFSKTITRLHNAGTKVTQTVASHDINLSREEFNRWGLPYDFPHLTERHLWLTYCEGQLVADRVICPSTASKRIVEGYGVVNATVIPHGVVPPKETVPMPDDFDVGYLGQVGPDKGLIYLLEAWNKLNFVGCKLLMAGRHVSQLAQIRSMLCHKGEVELMGFVKNVSDLYNRCSVYVQPSVTEGFGIEVLEAMAHARPVIVSKGAGAADVVTDGVDGFIVPIRDPDAICDMITKLKNDPGLTRSMGEQAREKAMQYTWSSIIPMYQNLWRSL